MPDPEPETQEEVDTQPNHDHPADQKDDDGLDE